MRYKLCFCKRHKENILIPKLAAADEYANICLCPAYKTGRFCEETLERLLDRLEINIVNKIQKNAEAKKRN